MSLLIQPIQTQHSIRSTAEIWLGSCWMGSIFILNNRRKSELWSKTLDKGIFQYTFHSCLAVLQGIQASATEGTIMFHSSTRAEGGKKNGEFLLWAVWLYVFQNPKQKIAPYLNYKSFKNSILVSPNRYGSNMDSIVVVW